MVNMTTQHINTDVLRAALKSRGLSVTDFASKLGVSASTVSRLLAAGRANRPMLVAIAQAAGLSLEELTGSGIPDKNTDTSSI